MVATAAASAGATASARSEFDERVPGGVLFARRSPSRRQSHGGGAGDALRCDACSAGAVGGIGGRCRGMDGDDVAPLEGGLLSAWWRLGFWGALVFNVLLVVGAASLWSALLLPIRKSPVVTTERPYSCAMPSFGDACSRNV